MEEIFPLSTIKDAHQCKLHSQFSSVWKGDIFTIAITRDNKFFITGCADGSIKIWDLENKSCLKEIAQAHKCKWIPFWLEILLVGVSSIQISPNNQFFLSCSSDSSIIIWDLPTKEPIHHFKESHSGILDIKFKTDRRDMGYDYYKQQWNIFHRSCRL